MAELILGMHHLKSLSNWNFWLQIQNKTEQAVQSQRLHKLPFSINIGERTDLSLLQFIAKCNQSSKLKNLKKPRQC